MDADIRPSAQTTESPCFGADAPDVMQAADPLAAILLRLGSGEQLALNELYELTASRLLGYVRFLTASGTAAQDIVSEVYVHVWMKAAHYAPQRGTAIGWLLMLCRSRALDHNKRRRTQQRLALKLTSHPVTTDETSQEENLLHEQRCALMRRELGLLSPIRVQLLAYAFGQDLTHDEIARKTGLPVGTVKSHIRRSLLLLKKRVNAADATRRPLRRDLPIGRNRRRNLHKCLTKLTRPSAATSPAPLLSNPVASRVTAPTQCIGD